jgi:hypothetical protein
MAKEFFLCPLLRIQFQKNWVYNGYGYGSKAKAEAPKTKYVRGAQRTFFTRYRPSGIDVPGNANPFKQRHIHFLEFTCI